MQSAKLFSIPSLPLRVAMGAFNSRAPSRAMQAGFENNKRLIRRESPIVNKFINRFYATNNSRLSNGIPEGANGSPPVIWTDRSRDRLRNAE